MVGLFCCKPFALELCAACLRFVQSGIDSIALIKVVRDAQNVAHHFKKSKIGKKYQNFSKFFFSNSLLVRASQFC